MPPHIWPPSGTAALSLPISGAATVPVTLQDGSGASLLVSGGTYTAIVYERLARTQAASGSLSVESYLLGTVSVEFTATGTADLSEQKHYFWVISRPDTGQVLLDGPVYAHLPGNWPVSPYRGHKVSSVLSVLT